MYTQLRSVLFDYQNSTISASPTLVDNAVRLPFLRHSTLTRRRETRVANSCPTNLQLSAVQRIHSDYPHLVLSAHFSSHAGPPEDPSRRGIAHHHDTACARRWRRLPQANARCTLVRATFISQARLRVGATAACKRPFASSKTANVSARACNSPGGARRCGLMHPERFV